MTRYGLSANEQAAYAFIRSVIEAGKPSPSYDEICQALSLRSKSGVLRLVLQLERKGYITRLRSAQRSIAIVPEADVLADVLAALDPVSRSRVEALSRRYSWPPIRVVAAAIADYYLARV